MVSGLISPNGLQGDLLARIPDAVHACFSGARVAWLSRTGLGEGLSTLDCTLDLYASLWAGCIGCPG